MNDKNVDDAHMKDALLHLDDITAPTEIQLWSVLTRSKCPLIKPFLVQVMFCSLHLGYWVIADVKRDFNLLLLMSKNAKS